MDPHNSKAKKLNVIFEHDLMEKLNNAAKDASMTWSGYIRQAVIEKIRHDQRQELFITDPSGLYRKTNWPEDR